MDENAIPNKKPVFVEPSDVEEIFSKAGKLPATAKIVTKGSFNRQTMDLGVDKDGRRVVVRKPINPEDRMGK